MSDVSTKERMVAAIEAAAVAHVQTLFSTLCLGVATNDAQAAVERFSRGMRDAGFARSTALALADKEPWPD